MAALELSAHVKSHCGAEQAASLLVGNADYEDQASVARDFLGSHLSQCLNGFVAGSGLIGQIEPLFVRPQLIV
ncbi:MAG: hypothetical protein P0Y65_08930 [Candidatus Devosia phytovorans]|uniref:Uncharacterized protein n=1 Tax=Candidatus Devosia phytovorans TaxID=3121372 RepID=A0AAJ6B3E7_9HYPH|nr:hypothetical protein [Devosia sp.]WEK06353.1 MAG: hypothetical protein P0Y65_08930 [Devosia sp.]